MEIVSLRVSVLALLCASLAAAGCRTILSTDRHADSRADFPPPRILQKSSPPIPGVSADVDSLKGAWLFRDLQQRAEIEGGAQRLFYLIMFRPNDDGTYELIYQASWGPTRSTSDPRFAGVEVRESGRYSLSSQILLLEPQTTNITQLSRGARTKQTIPDENRAYVARVDKGYLNLAGRCAKYQVEPICREPFDLWYSFRWGMHSTPPEIPPL